MGYNLGSRKQLLTLKVSFCINRPGSRGLMAVLATWKADLYDVISLKIEQLLI